MTKEQNNPQETPAPQQQSEQPQHPLWQRLVVALVRMLVGGTFLISGFAKAIDPWGTYYKLNDYLMAFGWESMLGLTTFGAFALAIVEFVLGAMIVAGLCRRIAPLMATLIMLYMTPLTLWLAVTNAVPDCGCFGDMIVMSNWATFFKNIALLVGCIYLVIRNKRLMSVYGPAVQWIVLFVLFLFALSLCIHGYFTQPLIDFRPYKVGTTLATNATSHNENDYVFVYEKDGVEKEFALDSVPDDDSGWNYVDRRTKNSANVVERPKDAITIAAWDNGDDVSDEILANNELLLILIPEMDKVSVAYTFRINELNEYANQHGVAVAGLTSGTDEQIAEWNDIAMAHYPLYTADGSEIKMIARGNPAIVYMRDRKIVWKRTLMSIDADDLHDGEQSIEELGSDFVPGDILKSNLTSLIVALLLVLIINRTHLLFRIKRRIKKEK